VAVSSPGKMFREFVLALQVRFTTTSKETAPITPAFNMAVNCYCSAVFGACFGFGAGFAVLGASISQFAYSVGYADTTLGNIFVYRGLGFLLGALLSMKALRVEVLNASKHLVCSLLIIIAGILLASVPAVSSTLMTDAGHKYELLWMVIVNSIFFTQGLCFGGLDAFSALSISEMWGQRTQPWMQTKNLFSNFGALAGPSLVATLGYAKGYQVAGCLGFASLGGVVALNVYERLQPWLKLEPPDRDLVCAEMGLISHTLDAVEEELEEDDGLELGGSPSQELTGWDDLVVHVLEEVQQSRSNPSSPMKHSESQLPSHQATHLVPSGKTFDFAGSPRAALQRSSSMLGEALHSPLKQSTLSFASPKLARKVRRIHKPLGIVFVPTNVRVLLAALAFCQLGLLCAFGGWVGTYIQEVSAYFALRDGSTLTAAQQLANAQQVSTAVLTAMYSAQIIGSALSVPTSALLSATAIMRAQLALAVAAGVLLCVPYGFFDHASAVFTVTTASAALMGLGLGCMYPLILTVVNDYGATM
jgi:MFS family permease